MSSLKMNKSILYFLILLVVVLFVFLMYRLFTNTNKSVANPQALKLVNVLDSKDFADGRIKGSINIPFDKLKRQARENLKSGVWTKDTPIVVYCTNYSCSASHTNARELKDLGFTNVCAYEGGIAEWYKKSLDDSSYQVEGNDTSKYLKLYQKNPNSTEHNSDICIISAEKLHKELAQAEKIQ